MKTLLLNSPVQQKSIVGKQRLPLHLEIALLAIDDKRGFVNPAISLGIVAGIMAELMIRKRIKLEEKCKKHWVCVLDATPTGDGILDELLGKFKKEEKRKPLSTWVAAAKQIPKVRERVTTRLCQAKILRQDREQVMWIFNHQVFPEVNASYERTIKRRMKSVMFGQTTSHDSRTTILIAIAQKCGLLKHNFDGDRIYRNQDRINKVVSGEMFGARAARSSRSLVDNALAAVKLCTTCE